MKAAALLFLALVACDMPVSEQDPAGPRGAQGMVGEPGDDGQPGRDATIATYAVQSSIELTPGEWDEAIAQCDPGDIVLAGGCQWGAFTIDGYTMGAVVPYLDIPTNVGPNGLDSWLCQGQSVVEHETRIYATALCLEGGSS